MTALPLNGHVAPPTQPASAAPPAATPAPVSQPVHPTQYQQPAAQPYQQPTQPAPIAPPAAPPAQPAVEAQPTWQYDANRLMEGSQPTTPAPSAPAAGQAPPQAAPSGSFLGGVRERFRGMGVDVSRYGSDDELLDDLGRLASRRGELEQYANYGQQIAPHAQEFQEYLRSKQAKPPQPEQPAAEQDPFDKAWGAPAYDPSWEEAVTFDEEKGEFVGKHPWTPIDVVAGVNSHHRFLAKRSREFLTGNPLKQTWSAIQDPIKKLVQEQLQAERQQFAEEQEIASFEQQNSNWLYQQNPATQQTVFNPATGLPVPSQLGNQFLQYASYFIEAGMPRRDALQAASQQLKGEMAAYQLAHLRQQMQQPQPGQPPQQVTSAPGTAAIAPAVNANPAQPIAPPAAPAPVTAEGISHNRIQSFLEGAQNHAMPNAQAAFHSPSAGGFSASPSDPVNVRSTTDLNNLWQAENSKLLGRPQRAA